MKILIVDTLSESGHSKFNQEIVDWLKDDDVDIYCSESMAKNFDFFLCTFSEKKIEKKNKLRYKLNQIILVKNVLQLVKNGNYDKILFLSYEPVSLLIWSHFFRFYTDADIFLFEHNTVPQVGLIKKILYKMISTRLIHIAFMDYITNHINSIFGKNSTTVRHPMSSIFDSNDAVTFLRGANGDKIIFMPSATIDAYTTNKIFQAVSQVKGYILYAKPNIEVNLKFDNVTLSSRFDNYNEMMISADVVVIPQHFDYRVSGVLYEALQSNALILVSDCIFGRSVQELYSDRVIVVTDWSKMFPIIEDEFQLNIHFNRKSYFSEWNKRGRDELYEALNDKN